MTKDKILLLLFLFISSSTIALSMTSLNNFSDVTDNISSELISTSPKNISNENTFAFDDVSRSVNTTKVTLIVLAIFILGIFIGAWIVFSFSKRKIYSILEEERVYYLDYPPLKTEKSIFHYITLFHVLKRRKDSYKRHNRELQKEMEEMGAANKP